jgi:hypothetical protein
MNEKQVAKAALLSLRKNNPGVDEFSCEFYGSGDSFDAFDESSVHIEDPDEVLEDLLWYAVENSCADFNDDGSHGRVIVTLRPAMQLHVEVYYYETVSTRADDYTEEFEEAPDLRKVMDL